MASIPRGIQVVSWKNATSKQKQQRYRIRINRKNFQCDKLFENLEEAIEFLNSTKNQSGINKLNDLTHEEQSRANAISEFLTSPPFLFYVNSYFEKYVLIKDDGTDLKKRNLSSDISRLNKIINREVEYNSKISKSFSLAMKIGFSTNTKPLKDFKLEEIDDVVITNYIRSRLAETKKPSLGTVKREVDMLSGVFTKIRYLDKQAYLTKLNGQNPCATADLSLLKGWDNPIKQRIKPELEKVIIKALRQHKNKEMLLIFTLAITTGMRRSEILSLTWDKVFLEENKILLTKTKSGRKREVVLTEDAKEVIKNIPKIDERLFHYTIDGYNTNWQRLKRKHGFSEVRMHDTRREFISKMLQMCSSSIVVADMISMSDINYFDKHYSEEDTNLNTQDKIIKSVGHARKSTTKGYFTK